MNQDNDTRTGRRRFLAGLTAIGGLAATDAALSVSRLEAVQSVADLDAEPHPHGYRETGHVRAYYRAARD